MLKSPLPPLPQDPHLTIVIPVLNETKTLPGVLDQVLKSSPDKAEILVVDGGSTDGTPDLAARYAARGVRVIHNPARHQSAGINLAVREANPKSDVLIRCDAHQHYPSNFVKRLVSTIRSTNADSVVVTMKSRGALPLQRAIAWTSNSVIGNGGAQHRGGGGSGYVAHGHHAAFRMATFRRLGGYDPTFTHNEDAEYDCRLRAAGGSIYLDASIPLTYFPRSRLSSLWRQYFSYGLGRARTVKRHPETLRPRQFLVPANLVAQLGSIAIASINPIALFLPLLYLATLLGFGVVTSVKQRDWAGILCAPAALTMHTAWGAGFLYNFVFAKDQKANHPARGLRLAAQSTVPKEVKAIR